MPKVSRAAIINKTAAAWITCAGTPCASTSLRWRSQTNPTTINAKAMIDWRRNPAVAGPLTADSITHGS
jgi:hypothetical protein